MSILISFFDISINGRGHHIFLIMQWEASFAVSAFLTSCRWYPLKAAIAVR